MKHQRQRTQTSYYLNANAIRAFMDTQGLSRGDVIELCESAFSTLQNQATAKGTISRNTVDKILTQSDPVSESAAKIFFQSIGYKDEHRSLLLPEKPIARIPPGRVGERYIANMPLIWLFSKGLSESQIECRLIKSKTLPRPLQEYYDRELQPHVAKLRKDRAITNNQGYSLNSIITEKNQTASGGRFQWPVLIFEPAEYYHQIMFNERLDEKSVLKGRNHQATIRDMLEVNFESLTWDSISEIPIPQRFANNICITISGDDPHTRKLVVGVRSKTILDSKKTYNLQTSCAEGMLRPDDADPEGTPSPFRTATRALREELGLYDGQDYDKADLKLHALGYDAHRCQPVAVFIIHIDHLNIDQIKERWRSTAQDQYECRDYLAIDIQTELPALMHNTFLYEGQERGFFSNHQFFGAAVTEHLHRSLHR